MKPFIYKKPPYRFCRLLSALGFVCYISISAMAQNLVPNGSFEEGISCVGFPGNVTEECAHWYASNMTDVDLFSSPEWFHACFEEDLFSPPQVGWGYQMPLDGDGYAGIVAFYTSSENFREIIGVQLSEPLNVGDTYLVEFGVSNMYWTDFAIASNRIGFSFSTSPFYGPNDFPNNSSHFSIDTVIPISNDWLTISTIFLADSAYQYFHIGNFYDDSNTMAVYDAPFPHTTYYAIDAVAITTVLTDELEPSSREQVNLYPNPLNDTGNLKIEGISAVETINVYNSTGVLIRTHQFGRAHAIYSLDLGSLPSGFYIIEILTPKTSYNGKIIKS